ncbi:MAG TPA: sulfite exporter TauE/SafE family protein [Burkholderiaceae bacterium]|nr:sulfite exporter TauE/SafE family protein [Burkholderiaceae bacterium]
MDVPYTLAGFVVGAIVGLTGVGGGSLMTPLLVLFFGIHPSVAVGTDLLYAAITKAGGTCAHSLKGSVDWRVTARLAAGSIPASIVTVFVMAQLGPASERATNLIYGVLGVALILTACAILARRHIQAWAAARPPRSPRSVAIATVVTGGVLGILVTISSVGAGALGVAALVVLYPRLLTARIVGSDIAHAVPLTLVAGLGHTALGNIDWSLLASLLFGSLPGIWLGAHLSTRLPDVVVRGSLAAMLVGVGGKLVLH